MKRKLVLLVMALAITPLLYAQAPSAAYQGSEEKVNDLVHSRLQIKLDFAAASAAGQVWLTLQPHFYATDSVRIDAKAMDIHKVALVKGNSQQPLSYRYDTGALYVKLDRSYRNSEKYILYIDYTVHTDALNPAVGKTVFNKGLHFINPGGRDKTKPVQAWTQGQAEATSCWLPTIDRPNQRATQEMYITVPQAYSTLSNGLLLSSKKNNDQTRTDYWKLDQPHAPYLFFLAAGEYAVVKEMYKGKEISYYVEKPYAAVAKRIFANTPEMMGYFAQLTGIAYPWPKYAQIAVRDYPGGGMENTTASLFQENIQQDARQLADGNQFEKLIAHELFHQWVGNYVTAESWSNLALNEAFANYAEILWLSHKYGKDKGDELLYNGLLNYVYGNNTSKELIRFHYTDKDELFDGVTYTKGGRVLQMLRNYVGDSAFFRSLNRYLVQHRLQAVEVHDLRLAFEEVTGRDLNWFFDQWFMGSGHPVVDIAYRYAEEKKQVTVTIRQTQSGTAFRLPLRIDVYEGNNKKTYPVEVTAKEQSFTFSTNGQPELVNVDADKTLVWAKKDNRDLASFIYQYHHAASYIDRREAIDAAVESPNDQRAMGLLFEALNDPFDGIVFHVLMSADPANEAMLRAVGPELEKLARSKRGANVRSQAIRLLSASNDKSYYPLFQQAVADSSYEVGGVALEAVFKIDAAEGARLAKVYSQQKPRGHLADAVTGILMRTGDSNDFDFLADNFDKLPLSQNKLSLLQPFAEGLGNIDNTERLKKGVDIIVRFRNAIPDPYNKQTDGMINGMIKELANKKSALLAKGPNAELEAQLKYINEQIPATPR